MLSILLIKVEHLASYKIHDRGVNFSGVFLLLVTQCSILLVSIFLAVVLEREESSPLNRSPGKN
jgi:hypothetical protein